MNVLGIDFGTSSTVAVLSAFERGPRAIEIDGSVTMSSAVFALEDGTLVVGQDAERRARLDPARFEPNPKRRIDEGTLLLGTNVVPVTDALAAVLRRVGEEAVRQLNGQLPDVVRLSHPAGWGATRQETLRQAATKAGFGSSLTLLPEPVAAAAHYAAVRSQQLAPGDALAVYDLGAGTFDCAVVGVTRNGFSVLAHNGLADLGSLDIDQALLVYVGRQVSHLDPAQWQRLLRPQSVADRRMRRALMQDVRDAKESLSRHAHSEVPMPEPFQDVLVTRTELEALVRPNLLRSAELLAETIREAGLTPQRLTGIYLVGGPSRMPLVASLLADKLGVVPTTLDQPETAVAFGLHQESVTSAGARSPAGPPPPSEARTVPAMSPVPRRGAWQPSPPVSPAPVVARRKSRKVPMLAGAGVLVLVAVLVTVLVLVTRHSDDATVANGTTAQQVGGGKAASCDESAKADANGLTDCIRQLAGSVVDRATCQPGIGGVGMPSIGGATIVTCTMPASGYGTSTEAVVYYQGLPYATLKVGAQSQMGDADQLVEGRWQGAGLSGQYLAGIGPVGGILLFGEDDKNVAGMLVSIDVDETVEDVVDYFEHYVKPGT